MVVGGYLLWCRGDLVVLRLLFFFFYVFSIFYFDFDFDFDFSKRIWSC